MCFVYFIFLLVISFQTIWSTFSLNSLYKSHGYNPAETNRNWESYKLTLKLAQRNLKKETRQFNGTLIILQNQAPAVQKVDGAIHQISLCLEDSAIGFPNTYPLDRDLSDG